MSLQWEAEVAEIEQGVADFMHDYGIQCLPGEVLDKEPERKLLWQVLIGLAICCGVAWLMGRA